MSWSLLPLTGTHRGESIPIRKTPFTIGRDPTCQIRAKSPLVAPQHCMISEYEGQLVIDDSGSEQGTFLDGQPVLTATYIGVSNVLQVGPLMFKVCWAEDVSDAYPSMEIPIGDLASVS